MAATKTRVPETQKWDKDKIADKFQKFHRKHKRSPKGKEAEARFEGLPSKSVVISHFGSWNAAIEHAGLPVTVAPQLRGSSKPKSRPKAAPRKRQVKKATPEALSSIPVAKETETVVDRTPTVQEQLREQYAANQAHIHRLTMQNAQIDALLITL